MAAISVKRSIPFGIVQFAEHMDFTPPFYNPSPPTTHTHRRDWNFLEPRRGSIRPKPLKKCTKLNWSLRQTGSYKKSLPRGRYGYFMEHHISWSKLREQMLLLRHVLSINKLSVLRCQMEKES